MSVTISKVLSAIILFVSSMAFSLIPYCIIRRGSTSEDSVRRRNAILAYLNCFAGGVFLATFLCHILDEGGHEFDEYKEKAGLDTDFPIFNVVVGCGFFLVAFMELIAKKQMHKFGDSKHYNSEEEIVEQVNINVEMSQPPIKVSMPSQQPELQAGKIYGATESNNTKRPVILQKANDNVTRALVPNGTDKANSHAHNHAPKPVGLRAFLLLIALSFHTVFDGLAVGLQTSESEVWAVCAAIAIHKSVIAFCIGLEIFQCSRNKPVSAVVWLFVFAIMSPIGLSIGIFLTTGTADQLTKLLVSSILQGLAAGTFMYVTFLEILTMHIGHLSQGNVFHISIAFVGFCVMALSRLISHDD
ncbi:Zinc transporter zip3 [Plakobranchus ocellatus]|uniref:Zinc transporter zip3 n=1 Tax=Plakobranchus ocellatus TaxID=259542 RepID=A0AAV4BSV1_9GAST|nr:Zinc transporter zip3 [Plakobranchus ocellatus]